MRIYRIKVEQQMPGGTFGVNAPFTSRVFDVKARNAWEAMRRVKTKTRSNDFMLSYPLDVISIHMLSGRVE